MHDLAERRAPEPSPSLAGEGVPRVLDVEGLGLRGLTIQLFFRIVSGARVW